MTLSRLSEKCQKCPFVDTCDHKQMEMMTCATIGTACASQVLVSVSASASATAIVPYKAAVKKSIAEIAREIEQELNCKMLVNVGGENDKRAT